MSKELVAVADIDCGTDSIRLKAARVDTDGMYEVVPRILCVIRLGRDMDKTHRFVDKALKRAYVAAREFASVIAEHPIDGLCFVTTSIIRDAESCGEFEDKIGRILGMRLEIVPGTEETDLSLLGAISVVNRDDLSAPYLVVNPGSGSTELVIGGDGVNAPTTQAQGTFSMNTGSMRVTERHLINDPSARARIDEAAMDVDEHIDGAFRTVDVGKARAIIGVSGTMTTITALAMGLKEYDHTAVDGHQLSLEDAYATDDKFLGMMHTERREYKTIHPGRIDVVSGGAVVWSRMLARVGEAAKTDHDEIIDLFVTNKHSLPDDIMLNYNRRLLTQ